MADNFSPFIPPSSLHSILPKTYLQGMHNLNQDFESLLSNVKELLWA